jgi:hypothetical protein
MLAIHLSLDRKCGEHAESMSKLGGIQEAADASGES